MVLKKILSFIGMILVAFLVFVALSTYSWEKKIDREITELISDAKKEKSEVKDSMDLNALPEPVQRYINYVFNGKPDKIKFVRLKQEGLFRTGPEQEWLPTSAQQYFLGEECAFLWKAKIKMAPMLWISARDKYYHGKGSMLIKILSSFTLADPSGKELDVSALIRYGAELPWFPSAFLYNDKLTWEGIDNNSAKLSIKDGENEGAMVFYFNEKGEIVRLISQDRYREVDGDFVKTEWAGNYTNYKEINGVKVPTDIEVIWNLPQGEFTCIKLKVTDIEYDILSEY